MKEYVGRVYADRGGHYRWRIRSWNGRTVAVSGESFASRYNARRAMRRFVLEVSIVGVRMLPPAGVSK